jgi:hypothetical protein
MMGYIKKEWVLVDFFPEYKKEKEAVRKVKKWIKSLGDDKMFFYINNKKTNGYITIFMDWDGSKEGWETSDHFDSIREEFVNIIKEIGGYSRIYRITDDEASEYPYMRSKRV